MIAKDDKQVVFRVLESNKIIAPLGQVQNFSLHPEMKATGDERVNTLRACFADVMMERAKVFHTPFPELADIAEQQNIKLDFDLNSATDESGEEDES